MTRLLEEACRRVQELPEADQDALAASILGELEDERRWSKVFMASPDLLADMASEARREHAAGRTLPLDPDDM